MKGIIIALTEEEEEFEAHLVAAVQKALANYSPKNDAVLLNSKGGCREVAYIVADLT